jgi:hypothetical protein
MKCSSSNGKHKWVVRTRTDFLGNTTQIRTCTRCHLKQIHVKNFLTGRSEGWETI